ncbi:MAG: PHP domain-containing protein [Dehalococcoidia bacterium]|nr:PHP domain-containing protein [Dehalococcoidia bacterium]
MEPLDAKRERVAELDLHLHSLASDGVLSPAELVALAASEGIHSIALTDHDTTRGIAPALVAAREWGVEMIPGIEMTAENGEELHILGYFIDINSSALQDTLRRLRRLRVRRAQRMVEALLKLNMPVDWEEVRSQTWESVGRPHIARAMVARGYVGAQKEAFDRYLEPGMPAYVPMPRPSARQVIDLIRDAGGVASLAHPIIPNRDEPWIRLKSVAGTLQSLKAAGLAGVEAYYPGYAPDVVKALVEMAESLGLIPTGGSDFHTPNGRVSSPGGIDAPTTTIARLRDASERLGTNRRLALTMLPW